MIQIEPSQYQPLKSLTNILIIVEMEQPQQDFHSTLEEYTTQWQMIIKLYQNPIGQVNPVYLHNF